ncbi:MAG: TonB-dependent receptor, partial [Flavobacteriales bacterium]|nr:TonB-dependent receptor [Flavobacteriales bacterium]
MRIFRCVLIVALCFSMNSLNGQSTIRGVVVDSANNETLIGATVQEKGTTNGTVTDIDGAFQFKTKGAFPVTILVQFIGYVSKEVVVENADKKITIKLKSEAIDIGPVEVFGQRISEKQKSEPLTMETFDLLAI